MIVKIHCNKPDVYPVGLSGATCDSVYVYGVFPDKSIKIVLFGYGNEKQPKPSYQEYNGKEWVDADIIGWVQAEFDCSNELDEKINNKFIESLRNNKWDTGYLFSNQGETFVL